MLLVIKAKFDDILTFREPRYLIPGKNGEEVGNQNLIGNNQIEHSINLNQWINDG